MTYHELASYLKALSLKLELHATKLSGPAPAKLAKTLGETALKLNAALDGVASASTPAALRLRSTLEKHGRHFDVKKLQSLAKKTGIALKGGASITLAKVQENLLSLASAGGVATQVADQIEMHARVLQSPTPDLSTEEAQRADVRRLGQMGDEEIEIEILAHYTDASFRHVAKAAGLKVTGKTTRKSLLEEFIHAAQRNYRNTRLGKYPLNPSPPVPR